MCQCVYKIIALRITSKLRKKNRGKTQTQIVTLSFFDYTVALSTSMHMSGVNESLLCGLDAFKPEVISDCTEEKQQELGSKVFKYGV